MPRRRRSRNRRIGYSPNAYGDVEAAGITSSIGLMKEIRRKIRSMREARRTRRRAEKVALLLSKGRAAVDDKTDGEGDDEGDADEFNDFSLDSIRARAGVLRTDIRLRQDELRDLERIMKASLAASYQRMDAYDGEAVALAGGRNVELFSATSAAIAAVGGESRGYKAVGIGSGSRRNSKEEDNQALIYQINLMEGRSKEIAGRILSNEIKLQRLERRILCCESSELGLIERAVASSLDAINDLSVPFPLEADPLAALRRNAAKFARTFTESTSVLTRKLERVSTQTGPNNREYSSVSDFVVRETSAGLRIVGGLLAHPDQLAHLVDPDTPLLVSHLPAILARLDRIESHVEPILDKVLNHKNHLKAVEPYLPEVFERFDDIEPHLDWILDNIDALAPYTGLLLKHIDELLLYAEVDEYEEGDGKYAFAEQLLPYLEFYISSLDVVGPHLPLLRPHLPLLLKHDRIRILTPYVDKLFAKGYKDLSASANMDILIFWFGWALRIPFVPRLFFSFPGSPGMVSFLANRLPKRLVRGRCSDVVCYVDGDYGGGWNNLCKEGEMEQERNDHGWEKAKTKKSKWDTFKKMTSIKTSK